MKVEEAITRVLNSINEGLERADMNAEHVFSSVDLEGRNSGSCRPVRVSAYKVDMGQTIRVDITQRM